MTIAALIVAAGQGVRMGSAQRKQYLLLAGRPILSHTIERFGTCPEVDRIMVAVPAAEIDYCRQQIISSLRIAKDIELVLGGARRQDSVRNGLEALGADPEMVLVHDGVRPLVRPELIAACIQGARKRGACIPVMEVTDTLKQANPAGAIERTIAREGLYAAQTPQAFQTELILQAHRRAAQEGWQATDDASLMERMGVAVHIIPGERGNIKITTPEDLRWAEVIHAWQDR
ncbi:MAG: 2-C-methyl-D-erythritol 4-phosphate cytidylyltransferase [Desulfatitalea sp.]|nr:2-C-methyl-D-erythritol 4-phosphate cytidylyltransferase [Desulfatitalea sp.]